ncbi:MAG TPA: response regulator [Rhodocyclaceae bacterium]|nr:response regulator [Rhodocyclaceae bacterium]
MKILVVDDDPLAGAMTGAVLECAGHDVVLAENGIEASEQLNENADIEMVVSDMNMPMVSGIDLFREMREQGSLLPFVLLTGDDPAGLLEQEPRLDGCLLKDANIEETLLEIVARFDKA